MNGSFIFIMKTFFICVTWVYHLWALLDHTVIMPRLMNLLSLLNSFTVFFCNEEHLSDKKS